MVVLYCSNEEILNKLKSYKILKNQGQLSILALVVFLSVSVLLVVFQPEPEANVNKPIPVVVNAVKLQMQSISPIVDYTGRLEPSKKAELKFEISGRLAKKLVQPGEYIKSGKKILILEEYYIYKKLYELAKKNYELQTKEVERMAVLDKKSLLSKSQYDKTIQKQIELESKMYRSRQDFHKTFIKANFSGVINEINIDEGDVVSPNNIVANLNRHYQALDLYVEVRRDVIEGLKFDMDIEIVIKWVKLLQRESLISFQTSPNLETYTHLLKNKNKR
jgi:multidrug efflux pump subunit AcrA (membrane-fusion protein)